MEEQEWSVRIEATGPSQYDSDWATEIIDAPVMAGRGPVLSVGGHEVAIRFNVWADGVNSAASEAARVFRLTLPELTPIALEVQTIEEQERQLEEANVPELLGPAELAEALGVSRQRVAELTASEGFPAPIARLRIGPVWQRSSLGRFMARWPRKGGRPRKQASGSRS